MPTIGVNDTRINYIQIDCEGGRNCEDLVMVHGLATNLAFWYFRHAPEFSKRYRITLYDLRGHGRSGMPDQGYAPKNMAADLCQLLDHLEIDQAHFIGHSFGGAVALNLACMDPERCLSLMLIDTHISAVRRLQTTKEWEYGKKIQPIIDQYKLNLDVKEPYFGYRLLSTLAQLQKKNVSLSQELEDLICPFMGKYSKRTSEQWLRLLKKTEAEKELMGDDGLSLDNLRKLTFPILAMYGEHSQAMSTGEQLLEVWPHADFRLIRGAGHFFPLTRPKEFMGNCRQFWKGALINKIPRREGDSEKRHFRSDRFYRRNGKWYIFTREANEEGPFADRQEAKEYLWSKLYSRFGIEEHG